MTEKDQVEFKWLEARLQGNDTVVLNLEDGAVVKVKVGINRAGVALNFRNPDGSAHYNVEANLNIMVIPPERKFKVPRASLQVPSGPSRQGPPSGQVA